MGKKMAHRLSTKGDIEWVYIRLATGLMGWILGKGFPPREWFGYWDRLPSKVVTAPA